MIWVSDRLKNGLIIVRSKIGKQLKAKASSPNRKNIAFFVLINSPLQYEVCILDPVVADMYFIFTSSSCEQHSIDFLENRLNIRLWRKGEDRNYLGAWHPYVLNVSSRDVGTEVLFSWGLIVLVDLCVNSDYGALGWHAVNHWKQQNPDQSPIHQ